MFFQQVQAIAPSIAAMDDDGKFCLGRQLHLVPEDFVLCFTRRMIVKIVQPDLAPGDYLGMPSKIPQPLEVFRLRFLGIVGMNAHGRINPIVLLGEG